MEQPSTRALRQVKTEGTLRHGAPAMPDLIDDPIPSANAGARPGIVDDR